VADPKYTHLDPVREDFLDFPTAWEIQDRALDRGPALEHHPRCSSVPGWHKLSGRGLLCDCQAVPDEWRRLVKVQQAARAAKESCG
jgi:hypothetical protein